MRRSVTLLIAGVVLSLIAIFYPAALTFAVDPDSGMNGFLRQAGYVIGAGLTGFGLGIWVRDGLLRNSSQEPKRRAAIGAGISAVTALALIAIPAAITYQASTMSVAWQADITSGWIMDTEKPTVMGARGDQGGDLVVLNSENGETEKNISGAVRPLHSGGTVSSNLEENIFFYDESGDQKWEASVIERDEMLYEILAERDDYVMVVTCAISEEASSSRACRLIGLNPNGEVEWERDVVLTAFLETSARFLSVEYLPPYAQVEMADSTKEFIDPVTGETVKELPDEMAASSMFNDLVFVTDSESSSCETTAYAVSDWGKAWGPENLCEETGGTITFLDPRTSNPTLAYASVENDDNEQTGVVTVEVKTGDTQFHETDAIDDQNRAPYTLFYAQPKFDELNRSQLSEHVSDNLLLSWDASHLTARMASTSEEIWDADMGGEDISFTRIGHNSVLVGVDGTNTHNPFIRGGDVISRPTKLALLDADTGKEKGSMLIPGQIEDAAITGEGEIFVITDAGSVLAATDE